MQGSYIISLKKLVSAASLSVAAAYPLSADVVKETQATLGEWIALEKQISEEKTEWAEQKEVLQNSIGFMEEEIKRLNEIIETAEETASAGERKRAELEEKKETLDAATNEMKAALDDYESRIQEMAKTWPAAFTASVDKLLKRIPSKEDASDTAPTIRLQNVVAILSQFDKFQSVVTKDTGIQDVDGESREVTTLYFGFAYAYFVDGSGQYAGYGHPSMDEGWTWVSEASLAPKVTELVAVYDRSMDAKFLGLPAKVVTP